MKISTIEKSVDSRNVAIFKAVQLPKITNTSKSFKIFSQSMKICARHPAKTPCWLLRSHEFKIFLGTAKIILSYSLNFPFPAVNSKRTQIQTILYHET